MFPQEGREGFSPKKVVSSFPFFAKKKIWPFPPPQETLPLWGQEGGDRSAQIGAPFLRQRWVGGKKKKIVRENFSNVIKD